MPRPASGGDPSRADHQVSTHGRGPAGRGRGQFAPSYALTGADGAFGWDVLPGFYLVEAELGLCTGTTPVYTIPPPVTGILLDLACPCASPGAASRTVLSITKLGAPGGEDALTFKGEAVLSATPPLDSPATGVRGIVASPAEDVLADLTIPPGTGWFAKPTQWLFKGDGRASSGVRKASLKLDPRTPGR